MTDNLTKECSHLIEAFIDELWQRAKTDPDLLPFIEGAACVTAAPTESPHPIPEKASAWLARALDNMPGKSRLHDLMRLVAPNAPLWPVFVNDEIDPALTESVIESEFAHWISETGDRSVALGLAIFGPDADYLPHTHDSLEIYFNLSGELTIQHGVDGEPFRVSPSDYSITPVNRVHSLRTGPEPVLVLYIWVGNPVAENWWWEADEDGSWKRTPYRWSEDDTWTQTGPTEWVSKEAMEEAHR